MLKINVNAVINGFSRFGVLPGEPALKLAREIYQLPGIDFKGIYAHEMTLDVTPAGLDKAAFETAKLMSETARLLRKEGIPVEHVSMGSSGTMRPVCRHLQEGKFPEITELHPGNFVIGDLIYMAEGGNTREMCAATILTTVISTADTKKAIIDAGFKTFGADYNVMAAKDPGYFWNGLPNFGAVQGRPDLRCGFLAAETGLVFYTEPQKKLSLGERIEIVPNNATLAISMHDQIYGVRNGVVEKVFTVTGRKAGY